MTSNNSNLSRGIVRSRSFDQYRSLHKRNRPRRRTLPAKFILHHNFVSHPYFSRHAHRLSNHIMSDNSIDTSSLNEGIVFYQNPNNDEVDYYWENELDICAPSLMPENSEMIATEEISGDSFDLEEKYFQIMFKELSKQRKENDENQVNKENLSPAEIVCPTETILKPTKNSDADANENENENDFYDEFIESDEDEEMSELLDDDDQEREEPEEEDPPSPLSPRDPEREGPVFSEEEENTEEGAFYRLEHDSGFQDEAGLEDEDDSGGTVSDDEGMDPMENQ